jgi:hypothetical protein
MEYEQNNMDYVKGNFEVVPNINLIPQMTGSTVKVYIAICKYANKKGQCYPSQSTIADWCNLSRRQVINSIQELKKLKIITVIPQERKDGGYTSNLYQIQQPTPCEPQFTPPCEPHCTQTILIRNHRKRDSKIFTIKELIENRYNKDIN